MYWFLLRFLLRCSGHWTNALVCWTGLANVLCRTLIVHNNWFSFINMLYFFYGGCLCTSVHLLLYVCIALSLPTVEFNPYLQQPRLRAYCQSKGIVVEAYGPIGSPGRPDLFKSPDDLVVLDDPSIKEIAAKHGATAAQVSWFCCWWLLGSLLGDQSLVLKLVWNVASNLLSTVDLTSFFTKFCFKLWATFCSNLDLLQARQYYCWAGEQ